MIRIVSITFVLVLLTIGGGISLSNAHGSAGKAALTSQDIFAPNAVMSKPLSIALQPAAPALPANIVTADVVTQDVMRGHGFEWRTFGPSQAPGRGLRPKSRLDRQEQTAQVLAPQAVDPAIVTPRATPTPRNVLRPAATAAQAPAAVPAVKRRSMHSNPNPGYLIGVFR